MKKMKKQMMDGCDCEGGCGMGGSCCGMSTMNFGFIGIVIIAVGLLFLGESMMWWDAAFVAIAWPVLALVLGVHFLLPRR